MGEYHFFSNAQFLLMYISAVLTDSDILVLLCDSKIISFLTQFLIHGYVVFTLICTVYLSLILNKHFNMYAAFTTHFPA